MASEQARQALRQFSDEGYALANRVSLEMADGFYRIEYFRLDLILSGV